MTTPLEAQPQINETLCQVRPRTPAQLRAWIRAVLGIAVPGASRCAGHDSPMDYLCHVFFERPGDVILWANRGGGKTFYGALATLLDLLFKPGIEVRILGGSFDQSAKMYRYLRWMIDRPALRDLIDGRLTQRGLRLTNGSGVELLAQSQTSVRGQRVQKLRCDEVELFDREVWEAAQFVTRSARCGTIDVRGSVEALSTMHRPFGLMNDLIGQARRDGRWRVFKWCVLDVMDRCEADRDCDACPLLDSCARRAKRWRGFLGVEDVIAQRRRSSELRFDAEMLCRRPSRADAVFPRFDPACHVVPIEPHRGTMWVGGVDFGMRSPFVMLWAQVRPTDGPIPRIEVIDEYIVRDHRLDDHLREMAARPWPKPNWLGVDPAGHQRNEQTGLSNIAVLKRAGYRIRTVRCPLTDGLERLRRRLESADDALPALVIHPRCRVLIEAMRGYHFDPDRPDHPHPVKDGYDHPVDALRYMAVNLETRGGRAQMRPY